MQRQSFPLFGGIIELVQRPMDIGLTILISGAFCWGHTEICRRYIVPQLRKRGLVRQTENARAKTLEIAVRLTTMVYVSIIYVASIWHLMNASPHSETAYGRVLGLGWIQPMVASSLMAYMAVDSFYLFKRRKAGMKTGKFLTVLVHHIVTFLMQPVSLYYGYYQYYGSLIVLYAESTSLFSNLFVIFPDIGVPKSSLIYKTNTVIFSVLFIVSRVFFLS